MRFLTLSSAFAAFLLFLPFLPFLGIHTYIHALALGVGGSFGMAGGDWRNIIACIAWPARGHLKM